MRPNAAIDNPLKALSYTIYTIFEEKYQYKYEPPASGHLSEH